MRPLTHWTVKNNLNLYKLFYCFINKEGINPTSHKGGWESPYYLILNNSKTLVARSLKLFHFIENLIWRFPVKFQGYTSIRLKNIDVLVKVGTLKSANPIYFQYISKNIKSSIKWTVVMLITSNLVSRHKCWYFSNARKKF